MPGAAGRARRAAAKTCDVLRLRPLLPLADLELHALTFVERLEAGTLDRREMDETVLATAVWRDEPVALLCVEPLHCSGRAHRASPCDGVVSESRGRPVGPRPCG